ncbi:hypothetical protein PoB_007020700 [Plakobranchus ocellatus]|uniref:Uncharacterized protein n=1 Tax=Plakobranchus ocellatus TaxID=259542 RepID=A0AAV4DI68_9GAST|nr:hypothetical protein PoB_007020700 [Plakobranchus ocellatus]
MLEETDSQLLAEGNPKFGERQPPAVVTDLHEFTYFRNTLSTMSLLTTRPSHPNTRSSTSLREEVQVRKRCPKKVKKRFKNSLRQSLKIVNVISASRDWTALVQVRGKAASSRLQE